MARHQTKEPGKNTLQGEILNFIRTYGSAKTSDIAIAMNRTVPDVRTQLIDLWRRKLLNRHEDVGQGNYESTWEANTP